MRFTYWVISLALPMIGRVHATLPDYFFREASVGYQNTGGAAVRLSERLTLEGWIGDYYQENPLKVGGSSNWSGWDFNSGFMVDLAALGPVRFRAGGHWQVVIRSPSYSETRPSLQVNMDIPAGPVAFDLQLLLERRYTQDGLSYGDSKSSKTRFLPKLKISPDKGLSRANLKPYLSWEGRWEKNQRPLHTLTLPFLGKEPCRCTDDYVLVDFWYGVELGVRSRLSETIDLGVGDQVMVLPGTTRTGHHRIFTSLIWNFDVSGMD